MNRYKITYKNKTAISTGTDALEAFEKWNNRPVFGNCGSRLWVKKLNQFDPDTCGDQWAEYTCTTDGCDFRVMVAITNR